MTLVILKLVKKIKRKIKSWKQEERNDVYGGREGDKLNDKPGRPGTVAQRVSRAGRIELPTCNFISSKNIF